MLIPKDLFLASVTAQFPNLGIDDFEIVSDQTIYYNCIAWAMGDDKHIWWPNDQVYWPPKIPLHLSVDTFAQAFAVQGYSICSDPKLENSLEKVALFCDANRLPLHAARQLPDGLWTSKLGESYDITHTLNSLEGPKYGKVSTIFSRPVSQ